MSNLRHILTDKVEMQQSVELHIFFITMESPNIWVDTEKIKKRTVRFSQIGHSDVSLHSLKFNLKLLKMLERKKMLNCKRRSNHCTTLACDLNEVFARNLAGDCLNVCLTICRM